MAETSKQLLGKVAIVTGASSGIGAGTAVEFASNGCSLALVGRNEANLNATGEKCQNAGLEKEKILLIVANLSKENETKEVVQKTISKFGQLDILINGAGILCSGDVLTCKLEEYDEIMNVNVRSILVLSRAATPYLLEKKGNIVNVSSITGIRPFANVLPYCMSKAALDQFTCCTALDLASRGVRVNSVNPGVIVTEIHRRAGMSDDEYKTFLEQSKNTHALGRVGTVEEVAQLILFLASDKAGFITGQTVAIDGGRTLLTAR
uniref:Ketoreductase domain-containing protein n=1 Tax=Strigamia maritima TaxID=126957 RepID=T1IKK2_STRMM